MTTPRCLLFDFGNTLAPFNAREADGIDRDLADLVEKETGVPAETSFRLWREARLEDFRASAVTGREHDFRSRLVRVLARAGREAGGAFLRQAEDRVTRSFVDRVQVPPAIRRRLAGLAGRFALGVLSNYLLREPIHEVLRRDGVHELFRTVVVSREVGFAKPDRRAFEAALRALGAGPDAVLFVGDDYENDIAGATACGMRAVWTWAMRDPPPEKPDPVPPSVRILASPEEYDAFLTEPG
jgi:FMN phosphatase YigB (HAD superfamily)